MEIFGLKIVFAFSLLASAYTVGVMPLCFPVFKKEGLAALGNCFAAGVFMAVSQIHLLPESAEALEGVGAPELNLAFLCCVLGYSLLLLVDNLFKTRRRLRPVQSFVPDDSDKALEDEAPTPVPTDLSQRAGVSAVSTLTVALAVHSLIEGMAIGVQTRYYTLLDLGLAVLFHKIPAIFSYGLKLKVLHTVDALALLLLVCTCSPVGIAFGFFCSQLHMAALTGILSALCAGTFLYITTQELIAKEFSTESQLWTKFASFSMGIAAVVLTGLVFSEE